MMEAVLYMKRSMMLTRYAPLLLLLPACQDARWPEQGSPIARLRGDIEGAAGEAVELDASESYDPDGLLLRYHFFFGDGLPALQTASSKTLHIYADPGSYEVCVSVEDKEGNRASDCQAATIHVPTIPPLRRDGGVSDLPNLSDASSERVADLQGDDGAKPDQGSDGAMSDLGGDGVKPDLSDGAAPDQGSDDGAAADQGGEGTASDLSGDSAASDQGDGALHDQGGENLSDSWIKDGQVFDKSWESSVDLFAVD